MSSICCGFVVNMDDKIWGLAVLPTYLLSNSVFKFQSFISHHATMHVHFDMERCKEFTSNLDIAPQFTANCGGKSK